MTTKIIFSQDLTIHGLNIAENFSYTVADNPTIIPAIVNEANVKDDVTWLFGQTEYTLDNKIITIIPSSLGGGYSFLMVEGEPEVTVDNSGNIESAQEKYAVANSGADANVEITSSVAGGKRYETIIAAPEGYSVSYIFSLFEAGSVGAHILAQMEAMIVGHTANTNAAQAYWSTNNGNANSPAATLNPTRFCASVDLSGISAIRDDQTDERYPYTLISSRHVIGAAHTTRSANEKIVFQKSNGDFVTATVIDTVEDVLSDTFVGLLDIDVSDAFLSPFKLMPENWEYTYAPSLHGIPENVNANITEFPTICKRMHNTSDVFPVSWVGINASESNKASIGLPTESLGDIFTSEHTGISSLVPWSNNVIPGDSGSPNFFVINGEPILISTNNSSGGSNDSFSNGISRINAAMNTLSGTSGVYAVEHTDLTEFNTY